MASDIITISSTEYGNLTFNIAKNNNVGGVKTQEVAISRISGIDVETTEVIDFEYWDIINSAKLSSSSSTIVGVTLSSASGVVFGQTRMKEDFNRQFIINTDILITGNLQVKITLVADKYSRSLSTSNPVYGDTNYLQSNAIIQFARSFGAVYNQGSVVVNSTEVRQSGEPPRRPNISGIPLESSDEIQLNGVININIGDRSPGGSTQIIVDISSIVGTSFENRFDFREDVHSVPGQTTHTMSSTITYFVPTKIRVQLTGDSIDKVFTQTLYGRNENVMALTENSMITLTSTEGDSRLGRAIGTHIQETGVARQAIILDYRGKNVFRAGDLFNVLDIYNHLTDKKFRVHKVSRIGVVNPTQKIYGVEKVD